MSQRRINTLLDQAKAHGATVDSKPVRGGVEHRIHVGPHTVRVVATGRNPKLQSRVINALAHKLGIDSAGLLRKRAAAHAMAGVSR